MLVLGRKVGQTILAGELKLLLVSIEKQRITLAIHPPRPGHSDLLIRNNMEYSLLKMSVGKSRKITNELTLYFMHRTASYIRLGLEAPRHLEIHREEAQR